MAFDLYTVLDTVALYQPIWMPVGFGLAFLGFVAATCMFFTGRVVLLTPDSQGAQIISQTYLLGKIKWKQEIVMINSLRLEYFEHKDYDEGNVLAVRVWAKSGTGEHNILRWITPPFLRNTDAVNDTYRSIAEEQAAIIQSYLDRRDKNEIVLQDSRKECFHSGLVALFVLLSFGAVAVLIYVSK